MAKQHFQHAHVNQKGSTGNQQPSRKQTNNKNTKIPGSMGSQNHWENQQQTRTPRFQNQWIATAIEKTNKNNNKISVSMVVNPNHWYWKIVLLLLFVFSRWFGLPIGPEILVFLVFVVLSMVLATHGSWNLGFLVLFVGFLDGFGYPSGLHTCIALVFSMVLQIAFAIKVVSSCIPYYISAVRFLRFPRGCLTMCGSSVSHCSWLVCVCVPTKTEWTLHAHSLFLVTDISLNSKGFPSIAREFLL